MNHSKTLNPHICRDARDVIQDLGPLNERFFGCTILLTGAAGFLGTHFVHYFALLNDLFDSNPCRVFALDSYIRGVPRWLASLSQRGDFILQECDVAKTRELPKADYIIHAASIASPIFYRQHPIETMDANVVALRNLLDFAADHPSRGFLNFSTSEIYGDPDPAHIPTEETYRGNVSCTGPRACYDESKRFGETLCVNFAHARGVPVASARPFNNYGPGLRLTDRRVLPDFFRDALDGRDIILLSDGCSTRTFCYIADALCGYIRILLLGQPGESYNIGAEGPEISMRELAELVIRITGSTAVVRHERSPDRHYLTDNPQRRRPNIAKARQNLGYNPRVTLPYGLERTHAYYRENRE